MNTSARIHLLAPEVRDDPYPLYAELRRSAPVCRVDPGGRWAVTRYEDVLFVLRNPQLFSSTVIHQSAQPAWLGRSNPFAASMFGMDPPEHGRLRALVSKAFIPAVIQPLEERFRSFARALVDGLPLGRGLDFIEAFALRLPVMTLGELLGLDPSLHSRFQRWAADIASLGSIGPDEVQRQAEARANIEEMEQHLAEVLARRRARPGADLMSELLRARVDGEALTQQELMGFFFLLLVAGMETTMHVLGHSARRLMAEPRLQTRLRGEPALIPRFIEEMLRFEPPVQGAVRVTTAPVELGGVQLAAGETVFAVLASACRDEAYCPDGDRFDIDRTAPPQSLPFGHGAHFCLGAALARLQARVGLEELLLRPRALAPGTGPLEWGQSMVTRGLRTLPAVILTPD